MQEVRDLLRGGLPGLEGRDVHLRDVPALARVDTGRGPVLGGEVGD